MMKNKTVIDMTASFDYYTLEVVADDARPDWLPDLECVRLIHWVSDEGRQYIEEIYEESTDKLSYLRSVAKRVGCSKVDGAFVIGTRHFHKALTAAKKGVAV